MRSGILPLMRISPKTSQTAKLVAGLLLLAVLMALLCTSGCGAVGVRGERSDDEKLAEAVRLTWGSYGCPGAAPAVLVVDGSELTCEDPFSGNPGFRVLLPDGWGCREGYSLAPGKVSVARRLPWSVSALRHELFHACLAQRGILDPWHLRDEWKTRVPVARQLLEDHGL